MKIRLSDVASGQCFVGSRNKKLRKKMPDGRSATIDRKGKVRNRAAKGDPLVDLVGCPLPYLGIGVRAHSGRIIEIG